MGLDDLDRELEERNLEGFWAVERTLIPEPAPTVVPHVWKWREIYESLMAGEKTRSHRHTSTAIYHAFRGGGVTEINGEKFEWEQSDCFVVPLWSWHNHRNASDREEAILFSINDRPMMEALNLYREEAVGGRR